MAKILVIDHGKLEDPREPSFFRKDIEELLRCQGFRFHVRSYVDIKPDMAAYYDSVISISGYCTIRGEEAQARLRPEGQLIDSMELEGKPVLALTHAAQVRAVYLYGNEAIKEAKDERMGIYSDYRRCHDDLIFRGGVNVAKMVGKEARKYDLFLGDEFIDLIVNEDKKIIIARQRGTHTYLMQLQPAFDSRNHPDVRYDHIGGTNCVQLLYNFLDRFVG